MFVGAGGSPHARFRRALDAGKLIHIRSAAAELPYIELNDALSICLLLWRSEPATYQRAALRWLARFCLERPDATLNEVERAARFLQALPQDPEGAERQLRHLIG